MFDRTQVLTQSATIEVEGSKPMGAYVARPAREGDFPGVVVAPELFGLSAHVRDVCERLAGLGLMALAPDLYHRVAPGVELAHDATGRERGFELLHQVTRRDALEDMGAAVAHLRAAGSPSVAAVGLSAGGHVAYLAATELDLTAVAVVYGGWIPTTDIALSRPEPTLKRTAGIRGRVLILVGDNDPVVPREHREAIAGALRAAGVDHEVVAYPGVGHGFLCDRRDTFEPQAAQDAWRRIADLLGRS